MKSPPILFSVLVLNTVFVFSSNAQNAGIFSGRGIPSSISGLETETESMLSRPSWPRLRDLTAGRIPSLFNAEGSTSFGERPFGRIFMPKTEMGQIGESGISENRFRLFEVPQLKNPFTEGSNLFTGMGSLFPPRDPSQPNFLDRVNTRSKELVDRTTIWAQQQTDQIRSRTIGSWHQFTDSFQGRRPTIPAKPPVRTAESTDRQPRIRF